MAQPVKDDKNFLFDKEARDALLRGAKIVYDAVTLTYGPRGKNVIIEKTYGRPVVTRDGVTVARESYVADRAPNMGAQLLIEASQTTNRIAGDGTTATVALTYHLIKNGLQQIEAGLNPMVVKQQITENGSLLLKELKKLSTPVKKGQLVQVATVSCGDTALGQLIAEAIEKIGPDGGLITEKAPVSGVERTYVNGYYLQNGFQAITEGRKELSNAYIVCCTRPISSGADIVSLINKVGERAHQDQGVPDLRQPLSQPPQIAFFGEFEGEAYNVIVANISRGNFDGTITKTPPLGETGTQMLDDLAIYTGGKLITAGERLGDVTPDYFGVADKVTATANETTVFGGEAADEDLEIRKKELRDRLKEEENDAVAEKLRDRLAKLENKIALFRIGGATETEREEVEFRIEDAIQATRAAAQHGVVPGGGRTLVHLANTKELFPFVRQALHDVFMKLVDNANLPPEVKLKELENTPPTTGFNLRTEGVQVDLVTAGILDPTLVLEQVIENATSTAANAVSLGAMITFVDKSEE